MNILDFISMPPGDYAHIIGTCLVWSFVVVFYVVAVYGCLYILSKQVKKIKRTINNK